MLLPRDDWIEPVAREPRYDKFILLNEIFCRGDPEFYSYLEIYCLVLYFALFSYLK